MYHCNNCNRKVKNHPSQTSKSLRMRPSISTSCPGCMCSTRSLELGQPNPSVDEGLQLWSRQARVTWLKRFKGSVFIYLDLEQLEKVTWKQLKQLHSFQVLTLRFQSMSNRWKSKGFFAVSGGAAGPLWCRPQWFSLTFEILQLQRIAVLQVAAFARGSKWMEAYNTMQELRGELRIQGLRWSVRRQSPGQWEEQTPSA